MEYRLYHQGQELGTFPITELRRRRAAGELTGQEWVWREGMPDWASLDSVLATLPLPASSSEPPPIPVHARLPKRRRPVGFLIALAILGSIAFGTFILVQVAKVARNFNQTLQAGSYQADQNSREGIEVTTQPIPVATNTLTEEDVRKRGHEFRIRQYLQAYRENGPHDQPWDADARQLIEAWIARNYGGSTNLPSPQVLGDKLAATPGCNDPLVLLVAAVNCNEAHEKMHRLERAIAAFPQAQYKAYPWFYATVSLAADLGSHSPQIESLDEAALKQCTKAFADGSFMPGDETELAEIFMNGWAKGFFGRNGAAVREVVEQARKYPWLGLVLEGENEIAVAWKLRGSGFSDTVTTQGWQGFSEHLAKAHTALTKAWELHPERPQAAARMVYVALGEAGAEEVRTWFDRAVSAQIDYPEAWSNLRWALRPRWHGSHEALLAMGVRALETSRFDTDVPRKLFDFISDVESELQLQPGEHIYGRPDIWPHLQQMYEGYIKQAVQGELCDQWRSAYTVVAFLAGHYESARKELELLNWKLTDRSFQGRGTDLSLLPLKVAALTGSSAGDVKRAEESFSLLDLPQATKSYTEMAESTNADERTRLFSRARLEGLKQETRLAKGEWIEFLPGGEQDPNWVMKHETLRRLSDGALEVEAGSEGHGFYCRTRVGPEFEITGEVEFVRSSTGDFQAGVIFGLPDSFNSDWYAFRLKRNDNEGQVVSFSRQWSRQQASARVQLDNPRNTFRFRLQGGKADAWLNENQVLFQASPAKSLRLHPDCMLGLGAYNDVNQTVLRYRNVKVRRVVPGR